MALTSYPFDNQDTTETQFSKLFRELQDSGVVDGFAGTSFQAYADSTGMTVKLRSGMAIVRGHVVNSDAVYTITLPAADSTARIDRIVLRLDPTANTITPTYIKGTPGQAAPAMTQTDTGIYDLPIATVSVAGSAPNIGPNDVSEARPFIGSRVGVWSTATRPASPRSYVLGANADLGGRIEQYDPTAGWVQRLHAHWGSGTAYPTVGIRAGDTFFHSGLGCLMGHDGVNWRQRENTEVADAAGRTAISTNYAAVLYAGFIVRQADIGVRWRWTGTEWTATDPIFAKMWRTAGFSTTVLTADTLYTVDMNTARTVGGFVYDDTNNQLTVPFDGLYRVSGQGYSSGGSGYAVAFFGQRTRASVADLPIVVIGDYWKPTTNDVQPPFHTVVPLKAGDKLWLQVIHRASSTGKYYGATENHLWLGAEYVSSLNGATAL